MQHLSRTACVTCSSFSWKALPKRHSWPGTGHCSERRCTITRKLIDHWIEDLSRTGRLTAGMNWYRANLSKLWKAEFPRVSIPVFGIWSSHAVALAEDQMIGSAAFVDDPWRYERLEGVSHWMLVDVPDKLSELILDSCR